MKRIAHPLFHKDSFKMELNKVLKSSISDLDPASIPADRKHILTELIGRLNEIYRKTGTLRLNFICTHNSRRSQIAQIWAYAFTHYFQLKGIESLSGGTEATAFHVNAIEAMKQSGFLIESNTADTSNPIYKVRIQDSDPGLECFSKTFEHPINRAHPFIAIMVCSDAEENCPYIPSAQARFSLKFEDPKSSDGSPEQAQVYAERSKQIARELFFIFQGISGLGK
jgi:arsenate reductase